MDLAHRLRSVEEYYFSSKLREIDQMNKEGRDVINLGIGSPDMAPHPSVLQTLHTESAKPDQHAYQSYKGHPALRLAIAQFYQKWYGVTLDPMSEILPLIGSKEGIMHVCMTFINEGDAVLIPNPGYPTYRSVATIAGGQCLEYALTETNGWFPDLEKLENTDLSKVKLMFVNYPHMPTGQLPTIKLFEDIIAFARKHNILICHDNPYSFILNKKPLSMLAVEGSKDVVIELNSLSKSHNMAGWRVGMLLGNSDHVSQVLRFKSNMDSGMFLPLQLAAVKALSLNEEWFDDLNAIYEKRRLQIFKLLASLGCTYQKEQAGMFVWAKIPAGYLNSYAFSDMILQSTHVFLTPGDIFGSEGSQYIRASLCTDENRILQAIDRIAKMNKINLKHEG